MNAVSGGVFCLLDDFRRRGTTGDRKFAELGYCYLRAVATVLYWVEIGLVISLQLKIEGGTCLFWNKCSFSCGHALLLS